MPPPVPALPPSSHGFALPVLSRASLRPAPLRWITKLPFMCRTFPVPPAQAGRRRARAGACAFAEVQCRSTALARVEELGGCGGSGGSTAGTDLLCSSCSGASSPRPRSLDAEFDTASSPQSDGITVHVVYVRMCRRLRSCCRGGADVGVGGVFPSRRIGRHLASCGSGSFPLLSRTSAHPVSAPRPASEAVAAGGP